MFDYELIKYEDKKHTITFPDGKLFRISFNSTHNQFKLKCRNPEDLESIIEAFSDNNPASFFMGQYGYSVPKKISVISDFGLFETGLIFEILKYIRTVYGSLSIVAISQECLGYIDDVLKPLKKVFSEKNITNFEISNIAEDSGRNTEIINKINEMIESGIPEEEINIHPFYFRPYQKTSIENILFNGYGKGIVELGTAAGKSFIIANLIHNYQKHINSNGFSLILVPNKQLVYQMRNDFLDYGFKPNEVTMLTAGLKKNEKFDPDVKIIVANRQFLFTNFNMLPKIELLFCDELHTCNADKTVNLIKNINSKYMVGCTGTMPSERYKSWSLMGLFCSIVYNKSMTELMNEGYVSKMKLFQVNIIDNNVENNRNYLFNLNPYKKYAPDENGYSEIPFNAAHDAEHEYYEQYYKDLYTPALEYVSKFDENSLILFDRIEFGKRLTELGKDIFKGKNVYYIDGSVPVAERLKITKSFENSGNNVLFAEFATFQVGVSIKRLTNLVFVSSSKSFPRIAQSIGRTLRLHSMKNEARIFDINFNFKYSQRHLKERLKIYKGLYNKRPDEIVTIKI